MLRPGVEQKLEQFVARGGIFFTTFFSGIVDENDHVFLGGYPAPLRKLLGIHVEEFDPLTKDMSNQVVIEQGLMKGTYDCTLWGELIHLEGASAHGVFAHDYYANGPALTVNLFGEGKAYYLATLGSDVLMAALARLLCHEANVSPILEVPDGVEATRRVRADGRSVYFLLNHTETPQKLVLPSGSCISLLDGNELQSYLEIAAKDVVVVLSE